MSAAALAAVASIGVSQAQAEAVEAIRALFADKNEVIAYPERYVVSYASDLSQLGVQPAQRRDYGLWMHALTEGVRFNVVSRMYGGQRVISFPAGSTRKDIVKLLRALRADSSVKMVEPDIRVTHTRLPDDPSLGSQWHYEDGPGGFDLERAWGISTGGGVVVAVLDTGQTTHPDLDANTLPGYDFISEDSPGNYFTANDGDGRDSNPSDPGDWNPVANECYAGSPVRDSSWHGTHVAGTVAALAYNEEGGTGVAYNAMVQHVRVLGRCGGYTSDIADAIAWASGASISGVPDNPTPASVINLSLGGYSPTGCPAASQSAINTATANGAVVVVSAGNSTADASLFTPANCDNVITVAATSVDGDIAYYSNFGTSVDVSAPGGDAFDGMTNMIYSTLNDGTTIPGSPAYAWYQGTSMAAPHISGLAALLFSTDPTLTPAEVTSFIVDNARAIAPADCPSGCGSGIADASDTLEAAYYGIPDAGDPPDARFDASCDSLTCDFIDLSDMGSGSIISYSWDFGDTNSSTAASPQHTYAGAGSYTVELTLTTTAGSDTFTQVVNPAP